MPRRSLLFLCTLSIVLLASCKKKKTTIAYTPYIDARDLRVGTYSGMFQECGPTVCYDIDTTFQITKEENRYYLVFGTHKDEIEYDMSTAKDFTSVATYPLNGSTTTFANYLSGYCRNDSVFVIYSDGWGVYNKNLLSGKKQ